MKTVTIGFSRAKSKYSIFSRLIRFAQNTPFSHVYIRIVWPAAGDDLIYQASGTKVNFEAFTHFESHSEVIAEFSFDVNDATWHKVASFMLQQLSKPYSIMQIIGFAIKLIAFELNFKVQNPVKNGMSAFICSELAEDVCQRMNIGFIDNPEEAGPKEMYEALVKLHEASN